MPSYDKTTGKRIRKPRTEEKKAARRIKDQERRDEGSLVGWPHSRRTLTTSGHKSRLLSAAKGRAKKKGLEFTITSEDFEIGTHCPVLGVAYTMRVGKSGPCNTSPSLDRIDSSLGYIPGNVEVISWQANRIKCDATPEQLMKVARYYGRKTRN